MEKAKKKRKKLPSCKSLRRQMEKVQDEKRYEHTLGVAFTAAAMAMRYGGDIKEAEVAGLLHDCAKCMSHEEQLRLCKKNKLKVTAEEKANPFLLHAKVGAFLAKEKYGVESEAICQAILYHTTGHPDMTLLDKIIFVADYIEPTRKTAPHLDKVRRLAFEDLDAVLCKILNDTLEYLDTVDQEIDPMTRETYDYYRKNGKVE